MPKVALEAVDKFVARVKFACQMLVLFVRLSWIVSHMDADCYGCASQNTRTEEREFRARAVTFSTEMMTF